MTPKTRRLGACAVAAMLAASGYQWIVPQQEGVARTAKRQPQVSTELERGPSQFRQVALTFDAGGDADGLMDLLRVLDREEVSATFFLTGRWACENIVLARMIAAEGHAIGNHTWDHRSLTSLEDWEVRQELLRTDDRFVSWFGSRYHTLFRAPYGEVDTRVLSIVQGLGFHSIRWSIDTLDAMEPRKTASFIEGRILGKSDEELQGAIVLMHVGYPETVEALPVVINNLRERGFDLVTIPVWIPESNRWQLLAAPRP
jgi:peptidoglycan/xylan/chitin deacetylase (PgdA/CDA1 family)